MDPTGISVIIMGIAVVGYVIWKIVREIKSSSCCKCANVEMRADDSKNADFKLPV